MNTKGGVGKSSTATGVAKNLSKRTKKDGKHVKVGFIDIDVCSSNTEQILKLKHQKAETIERSKGFDIIPRKITPNLKYMGIKLIQEKATSGTQISGISQVSIFEMMLKDVVWGKLDCFILDLPAGTDDIFLSIPKILKDSFKGLFIVTQPKTVIDCRQVIELCGVHKFKILGMVENMVGSNCSCHNVPAACPVCHVQFAPFGKFGNGVINSLAEQFNIDYCGHIPLTDGDIHVAATPTLNYVSDIILQELGLHAC